MNLYLLLSLPFFRLPLRCGADCEAESYYFDVDCEGEEDFCPACYASLHKGKGGEHQRMGVKVEGEEGEAKEAGAFAAQAEGKNMTGDAGLWAMAAERFASLPYSNGRDKRYEAVKAEIRALYGATAINSGNKARLKALAVAKGRGGGRRGGRRRGAWIQ